jgi:rhodanese-related sulfurtransferase
MSTIEIRPDMTMEQILRVAPSAQRALFMRYHVGGCSSCGFQPSDTLAEVCKERNLLDVDEVIRTIQLSQQAEEELQIEPREVKRWLDEGRDFTFLDVRGSEEIEMARLAGAEPLDFSNSQRYMELPKDRAIVFACKSGVRSVDVAAYFKGHGFNEVYSMRGGLDRWREEVDPRVPAY